MRVYNTLTRQKEELIPVIPDKIGIYSCGPTVYNYFHIGNARPFVVFDTLRRYLIWRGYEVTFVQNFTDIDDKMIKRAHEEGVEVKDLARRFIEEYYADADALGVMHPDVAPRATEHVGDIISLIQSLMEKGHAYESGGDVYFDVSSLENYGKLLGQSVEDLDVGARVDASENKRNPLDFVLWKAHKPGEPAWDSPWGKGRPGWHVECSAMSMKYLGETFDIHAGGVDLVFPHHENEIAQSEAATGKPFARYWLHNGHINVNNQKMSKSLGNFFTVRDILKQYEGMAVRLFLLLSHYRSPINFSQDLMDQATSALARIRNCCALLARTAQGGDLPAAEAELLLTKSLSVYKERFIAAMDDDLNTADALGTVFELVREANIAFAQGGSHKGAGQTLALLRALLGVLGLDACADEDAVPEEIQSLAQQREQARAQKEYARADKLRDEIAQKGYVLEDTAQGPVIKKA